MSRWSDWLGGQARPQHSQVYLAMLLFGLIISLSTASAQSRVSVQAGFNSPYFGIATGNTGGFSQYGPYGGGYGSVGPSFYPGFGEAGSRHLTTRHTRHHQVSRSLCVHRQLLIIWLPPIPTISQPTRLSRPMGVTFE